MSRLLLCFAMLLLTWPAVAADGPNDHFERRIRPLILQKCIECHSGRTPEGDLDLSTQAGFQAGGMGGPIVRDNDVHLSALYDRLVTADVDLQMPPDERMSEEEIAAVRTWIEQGGRWPEGEAGNIQVAVAETAEEHWAFQPLTKPAVPIVENEQWCWTDIDRFVLAKQEAAGVAPVADADGLTWIRRATLDATGLPPSPEQLGAYFNLSTANPSFLTPALRKQGAQDIERLLQSKAYAERQARHWLDVARYADTSGDGTDMPVPEARYYRDWVIQAFQEDMPYDQFIIEQLAGDQLADANVDDPMAFRKRIATGFIALSRRFGNSRYAEEHQILDDTIDTVGKSMLGLSLGCARCHHHKFDPVTTEDYYGLYGYFASTQYPHAGTEHQKERADFPEITVPESLRSEFESTVAWAVSDKEKVADARVHIAGDPGKKGDVVPRGFLSFLSSSPAEIPDGSSGRLQLAEWIASADNPLTARVMVNRIWQSHFGQGLVANSSNFGVQTAAPLHRELLDYLANEFIASGWSVKHMHRLVMSSHVYFLSSQDDGPQANTDEANELLWHFPRQRMDAETFRDSILLVSGRLQPGSNGRHPFKKTEDLKYSQGNPFSEIFDHEHRSVYLMEPRLNRHPMMALFDGPDPNVTTAVRSESTVPLQALFVINGEFVKSQAESLAERIVGAGETTTQRADYAWQLSFSRFCQPDEVASLESYLESFVSSRTDQGIETEQAQREAWTSVARTLLASNEFIYID